ncbi:MAG: restriction endonuclease subunit S [Flavobacterium sp.]|nr:restriction endonuclease subunit S [Flavobacterium sp.]
MQIKQGYKQTELGVIPVDWEIDLVKNLSQIKTGSKNTQDRIEFGKYPFYVRSQTVERINSYSYDGEAVLTAGDGVGVGKVIHYVNEKFDCHQRVYRISEFTEKIDGYYFFLYFKNNFLNRIMQMTAKSSVDSVRMDMISDMQIPYPKSKKEQTDIATALSDADAWITSLEQLIAKKRLLKQGAMQELLKPKEGWEVKKLGDVCDVIIGLTYSPNDVRDHGTLVLRSSNIQNNKLAFENNVFVEMDLPQRVIVKKNDILVCVRNGSKQLIGKCALIDKKTEGQAFGAFMAIIRSDFNRYIYYYFLSNHIQIQIDENMGATINQLTNATLKSFEIYMPKSKQEQTRIATILSDMDAELTALESQLEKAKKIKLGMMQELLTGRIRLV